MIKSIKIGRSSVGSLIHEFLSDINEDADHFEDGTALESESKCQNGRSPESVSISPPECSSSPQSADNQHPT